MVSFSTTLSDPNPGFKVTVYVQVKYLQNGARPVDKVTIQHYRKPYPIYGTTFNDLE